MSVYLLANIGTRDVQLDSLDDLPPELVANAKTGQLKARRAGEYLQEQFARFQQRIRLPMLEKALRFITPKPGPDLRIVLFATDQDESVQPFYRDNDTLHFAQLIRELLFARHQQDGLAKKQIEIRTTSLNPADYDLMHDFYSKELPVLARRTPAPNPAFLLIAGGTPQMNTMLLFVGSAVFGPATQPLYVSQEFDRAHHLDIARQLYLQAFQRGIEVVLRAYTYSSALELLDKSADYLEGEQARLLRAALSYGLARRNLDLEAAARAFDATIAGTRALRGMVQSLQGEVEDLREPAKLRETIFLAQLAARGGAWADFLSRLHRFSEGSLQLIAEGLGVAWGDPRKRASYARAWWDANRPLLASLGLAAPAPPDDAGSENKAREVDRANLRLIVAALAQGPEHEALRQALAELELVDRPVALRNDIVHRFTPISQAEVEARAAASVDELLAAMRNAYRYVFGAVVPEESPYDSLNRLCADILRGQK